MMSELIISPRTDKAINEYIRRPAAVLLLTGPPGAGKTYLAERLAAQLLGLSGNQRLADQPFYSFISRPPKKSEITIETVRQLIRDSRLRLTGSRPIQRVVVIDNARDLSHPAQNALLKLLEEPPPRTIFILSTPSTSDLLPTIVSRSTRIEVLPVSLVQAAAHYGSLPSQDVEAAWRLSLGRSRLLDALLDEDQQHPLKLAVVNAKKLVGLPPLEFLVALEALEGDEAFQTQLEALNRLLAALQRSAIAKGNDQQAELWLLKRRVVAGLQTASRHRANRRLSQLEAALNLSR